MSTRYVPPHLRRSSTTQTTSNTSIQSQKIAQRRLARDLIELERANISSIAAYPIDDNIFEWHVNIKPTDGVYCGVYFHLIMTFPDSYPSNPPQVFICTPISHPNIFNSFLCLSMLRPRTGHVPYEGWSGAYSVVSILMQLQSFLFADKIDQDGGYQANAQLSLDNVKSSIQICKTFQCNKCSHSHDTPWPKVKGPKETSIKMLPIGFDAHHVMVQGSSCQTTHTHWVAARCELSYHKGKIFYEANIDWIGREWSKRNTRGGLCRFGFGTQAASICGSDTQSFGYGGTGKYSFDGQYDDFGERFTEKDTITVAVDFDAMRIYFAKNGRLMEANRVLLIPDNLRGKPLFPLTAFKNARIEFHFGAPKKPCQWLLDNGFKSLQQIQMNQLQKDHDNDEDRNAVHVDWHSQYIIPELWVVIFAGLSFEETFRAQFVCSKWYECINKYNMMERGNEMCCYYTKAKLDEGRLGQILGFGVSIRGSNVSGLGIAIHSQMDILSLNAWNNGCRTGVWGEELTHFLPLAMNRKHAFVADTAIQHHVQALVSMFGTTRKANANELERRINRTKCLQLVDTLVTMMNLIVVQFVMDHENLCSTTVSMVMCEKVVLGFCAFHHLLLYLVSQNKETVTSFANKTVSMFINNGSGKKTTRDLGKFLIYLMISSEYDWNDVSQPFVQEALTRGVLFMLRDVQYRKYDTTSFVPDRLENTFTAYTISRRLIMFQVWFMKNCASETLKGYNQRLGRPDIKVRKAIFNKTKFILSSSSWHDFFNELQIVMEKHEAIDRLLRCAIYNSDVKGYHRHSNCEGPLHCVNIPNMGGRRGQSTASTVNNERATQYSWRNNRRKYENVQQIRPKAIPYNSNRKGSGQRTMRKAQSSPIRPNGIRPERQCHVQSVNMQQSVQSTMSKAQRRKLRRKNSKKARK